MLKRYIILVLATYFAALSAYARQQENQTDSMLFIDEVVVIAKSKVREVRESSYNVVALDVKNLHNTSIDLVHALDRISGVKIRETGGTGSGTQIILNGFSGRHVKVFMDGIPMDGSGSSFQLNNIPVGLAERIEVYKGVVPAELGADALGGAINIISQQTRNTYADASYSFGSFNTHKSSLSIGRTTENGFLFHFNVYQNYSDNNYKVTLSREKADIQNANLMKIVYGGRQRRANSLIPSLSYEKRNLLVQNLNFSLTANRGIVHNNVWHITGNYFLPEIYNDTGTSATAAATRYGTVNVETKTFAYVSGIPDKDLITATGQPASYGGRMYFPITAEGADPAVYVIDPVTATAVKGVSVAGATRINATGRLTYSGK